MTDLTIKADGIHWFFTNCQHYLSEPSPFKCLDVFENLRVTHPFLFGVPSNGSSLLSQAEILPGSIEWLTLIDLALYYKESIRSYLFQCQVKDSVYFFGAAAQQK